jgi:hypothetical protein
LAIVKSKKIDFLQATLDFVLTDLILTTFLRILNIGIVSVTDLLKLFANHFGSLPSINRARTPASCAPLTVEATSRFLVLSGIRTTFPLISSGFVSTPHERRSILLLSCYLLDLKTKP